MPTKTTTVKEVVSKAKGKSVKVDEAPDFRLDAAPDVADTVERSKGESTEEAKAPKKAKGEVSLANLTAYADFELLGKEYKVGDKFVVPEGWVHEPGFDTFRSSEFKNKGARDLGMAFTVPGEIINRKTGERSYSRQVLPVKEG